MVFPEIPLNENERLEALKSYSILDTVPEKEYDEITFLASYICQIPISLISLIDDKRQWFKSHYGLDASETPKDIAFCAHAINDKDNMLIVPDSRNDIRFHDNPLVINHPHVIFYAGIPLVNSEGFALGTLCVIDNKPNNLNPSQIEALKALSNQLIKLFDLRKKTAELEDKINTISIQNKNLERFASVAAHDIKSPLNNIMMLAEFFETKYAQKLDKLGLELLGHIKDSSLKLGRLIEGILKHSRNDKLLAEKKEEINLRKLIFDVLAIVDSPKTAQIEVHPDSDIFVTSNRVALDQIFINLLTNSLKYNDKEKPEIKIIINLENEFARINIIDNGPGINAEDQERIFQLFETTLNKDKHGDRGSGIGLATVQALVEGLGGEIKVTSEPGNGADFEFTIKNI